MQVRVGVGVFVFREHGDIRFITGIRKGSTGSGTLSLPGGHLEHGETFERCAKREVLEETGIEITDVQFVTATETVFGPEDDGKHYVTNFMTAYAVMDDNGKIPEPELLEPEKCLGWQWRSFTQTRDAEVHEGVRLFEPMRSLMAQRPDVCTHLERFGGR